MESTKLRKAPVSLGPSTTPARCIEIKLDQSLQANNPPIGGYIDHVSLAKTSSGMTERDSCASGSAMFAFLTKLLFVARVTSEPLG